GDDADEEVRREERAEEHRLGDDEEQDPERGPVDARALVGLGRAVMVLVGAGVAGGDRCALHQASSPGVSGLAPVATGAPEGSALPAETSSPDSMCSIGLSVISLTR